MRRIDLTSAGFLLLEKRETPMHVGGINLFTLPDGASEHEFLGDLRELLRSTTAFRKPFGEYVVTGKTGLYWEKDEHIDLDYHVRHSALPAPGRYRELFALASRLHTTLLDRTRPLWELHLIEGLQNRQFAVYNKIHHAAIDGVGAMHLTRSMCSEDPAERIDYGPFSLEAYEIYKELRFGSRSKPQPPRQNELRNVVDAIKHQYDSSMHLVTAMRRFGAAFVGRGGNLAVPWHNVPKTTLNTRVSGARRFVAQSFDFQRVRGVGKAMDATVNDVVLAMCSGALRRYLLTRDELPRHSLKAMAPVSLREETDLDSTNAVGFITADLATNVYDPEKRLRTIQDSMRAGKDLLRSLSSREAALFMQLTQVPALLTSVLGLASRYPAFSTVVSNVPGPRQRLYWNGARLDGLYHASIVFDGFAMNITMVSYVDKLDFGIVACRRSLPQVQRMIDHLEDALAELEVVAGTAAAPARGRPAPGRGSRRPARQAAGIRPKLAASDKAPAKSRAAAKKKATPKKTRSKRAAASKAPVKKAAAKKAAPGSAAPKKAAANKAARKTAAKKKAAPKKATPKKAAPKKAAPKKARPKQAAGGRRAGSAQ